MKTTERATAKALLDIKAVLLSPEKPFVWASGWHSPIYCDNRQLLSYPQIREVICNNMADYIKVQYPDVEVIAGVATGAIAYAALVAHFLNKPMVYVRPKAKDHGTGSQIEGALKPGQKVVVVEDLISPGQSSLVAAKALTIAGARLLGMVALSSYNFDIARKAFENECIELATLTDYDTIIEVATETGYVKESDLDMLKQWRFAPATWGRENE